MSAAPLSTDEPDNNRKGRCSGEPGCSKEEIVVCSCTLCSAASPRRLTMTSRMDSSVSRCSGEPKRDWNIDAVIARELQKALQLCVEGCHCDASVSVVTGSERARKPVVKSSRDTKWATLVGRLDGRCGTKAHTTDCRAAFKTAATNNT